VRQLRRIIKGIAIVAPLLASSFVKADEYHYRDLMVGERATGLGGAYVAISDDPSGIYHNPAGIMFSFENYFSLSANAYNVNSITYKNVFGTQNYNRSSSGVVPNFFGFIQNYRSMKWGFAIVVPNSDSIDQDDEITNISASTGGAATLDRKLFRQDTTTLFGPAIAFEAFKNFTVGLSVFVDYHVDKAIDNQLITYNADASNKERFYTHELSYNRTILSLMPKLGFQYMPAPKWSLGLVISKPVTMSGSYKEKTVENAFDTSTNLPADYNYVLSHDLVKGKTNTSPKELENLEVGFGVAYLPSKKFLLSSDFYYYGESKFSDGKTAVSTYNFSLGSEYYFTDGFAGRFGFFTNNANTPTIVTGMANQLDNVNFYGLSTGLSWINSGSSFTLGLTYSTGSGKAQAIGDSTVIQNAEAYNAMVYLTGSYQL